MIKLSEQEWKDIPEDRKRKTPLTDLRQFLFTNKSNPEGMWITEDINFIVLDKEGSRYENNVND